MNGWLIGVLCLLYFAALVYSGLCAPVFAFRLHSYRDTPENAFAYFCLCIIGTFTLAAGVLRITLLIKDKTK